MRPLPSVSIVIEKLVFTDPSRQALFLRVVFTANEAGITPYLLANPHVENTGRGDVAYVGSDDSTHVRGWITK